MDVSVIIPNFNGRTLLEKNLPKVVASLQSFKDGKTEIIVPDDGSTDDSMHVLEEFSQSKKHERVGFTFFTHANKGFSGNVNSGVARASGDIIILLNSDVTPHKDFLRHLLPHFQDSEVFAVGCLDESIEDGEIVLRGRGVGRWEKGFLFHGPGKLTKTNSLWASGGSSAFRKKMWDKLGGLNELYNPFYWEDVDLSYRALKSGYKVLFEKESKVVHEHSKGAIRSNIAQTRINTIATRNQILFVWLNITDTFMLLDHVVRLPYYLCKGILTKDMTLWQGFLRALLLFPSVSLYRMQMRKFFKRSDRSILQEFRE